MRTSIRDIAAKAGVSAVTVSNVLRGRDSRASEETRIRVLEAARELRYVPVAQPTTQSRHVKTHIIGLVFDLIEQDDYWGSADYRGLREGAVEHGYDLLTLLRSKPKWMLDEDDLSFLDRRSDGYIFLAPRDRQEVLQTLVEHHIPCVVCYSVKAPKGVATVSIDDAGAMRRAVQLMLDQGHRRILHVTGPQNREDFTLRIKGYSEAVYNAGLRPHILETDWHDESWPACALEKIQEVNATAVVAATDDIALGIWDELEKSGLRVPEDISLTGMDDFPRAAPRGLTTFRFSRAEVGRCAVDALVHIIEGGKADHESRILSVELVERNSIAPPRN